VLHDKKNYMTTGALAKGKKAKADRGGGRCILPQGRDIGEVLARLLNAGVIKEVQHLDWIANTVLVPKKNGKCSKDPFPLPQIDHVVDLTVGCELLSFLDACLGYHQIPLIEVD
jgi:hypothetical protein